VAQVAGGANRKHNNFQHAGIASNGPVLRDSSDIASACPRGRLFESRLRAAIQRSGSAPRGQIAKSSLVHVAAGLLRDGTGNIGTVASRVCYRSEAAFSIAFKRWIAQQSNLVTPLVDMPRNLYVRSEINDDLHAKIFLPGLGSPGQKI
jgi:hypothetical protein